MINKFLKKFLSALLAVQHQNGFCCEGGANSFRTKPFDAFAPNE